MKMTLKEYDDILALLDEETTLINIHEKTGISRSMVAQVLHMMEKNSVITSRWEVQHLPTVSRAFRYFKKI